LATAQSTRSAPGIDDLSVSILKNISESIAGPLSTLFNRSIQQGIFPANWKIAKVIPIPKPGDKASIDSYRPISLLPILSKVFERHILSFLYPFIRVPHNQFGFVKRRSTNSALISAAQTIHNGLDNKKFGKVIGIFLDVRKAFDRVPHSLLLRNLQNYHHVPSKILSILASYLCGRSQFVSAHSATSKAVSVPSGVPQGSILGPVLFTSFIAPFLEDFKKRFPLVRLIAYADDLLLIASAKSIPDLILLLQPALDFVNDELSCLGLELSVDKTKAILFRYLRGQPKELPILTICGQTINFTDQALYLGIIFTSDMSFSAHVSAISKKARCMLGALRRKLGRQATPDILETVYQSCIRSVIDYGSSVYDPIQRKDVENLERVQIYAARLCRKDWSINSENVKEKCGWPSLFDRRKHLKLFQFYKFYHGIHDYSNANFIHKSDTGLRFSQRVTEAHHLVLPWHRTTAFTQSFEYSAFTIWNSLPQRLALPVIFDDEFGEGMCNFSYMSYFNSFKSAVCAMTFL
jgi:hypothetical protein